MMNFNVRNYKCFGETGADITGFKDINIIIGKNNVGKSSIIDIVKYLILLNKDFSSQQRNGKNPILTLNFKMTEDLIRKSFPENVSGGKIGYGYNHQEYGLQYIDKTISFQITDLGRLFLKVHGEDIPNDMQRYFDKYINSIPLIFDKKFFIHLTAERDIQPEISSNKIEVLPNGVGATNFIQQIINRSDLDSTLVEKILLEQINYITNPDISFTRILVQLNGDEKWEIFFENDIDGRISLSNMGSGVKTILLVIILIIVRPRIEDKPISQYIFALEELENNLHPSQQRRLYYFLHKFSQEYNCKFFLTTHSNIVIDLYNKLENTQILHISRRDDQTEIKTINQYSELNQILEDLDIKASDILQSNSIIWVEGPSDRIYINKWLSLLEPNLKEGYHYSIMFYGGRLLSNISLDYEYLKDDLIPLLKLNRNSFVVLDRDGKTNNAKLNDTKNRIKKEIGEDKIWVTKGREIENYITDITVNKWLEKSHNINTEIEVNINLKFEQILDNNKKASKIKYHLNKNKFALQIVEHIENQDLNSLDLKLKIEQIIILIKKWNKE